MVVALWTGRLVACFVLILGALVFVTFLETLEPLWLVLYVVGVGGAILYVVSDWNARAIPGRGGYSWQAG
jgi:hypothetical protein